MPSRTICRETFGEGKGGGECLVVAILAARKEDCSQSETNLAFISIYGVNRFPDLRFLFKKPKMS